MKRLAELARGIMRLLRFLGDESGYERHLAHTGAPHSAAEWHRFSTRRWQSRYRAGRCC